MSKWGNSWDDVESSGGLDNGWHDLMFGGHRFDEKENGGWLLLKFPGASLGLNFFPDHEAPGHQKAHQISLSKLKAFFLACGLDKETMPDMDPVEICKALDSYEASGMVVGCMVGDDGRGYKEVKNFRKAK